MINIREKKKDRFFALKHARKCALKGRVTLVNVLEARANAISPVIESEREEIDNALKEFWGLK